MPSCAPRPTAAGAARLRRRLGRLWRYSPRDGVLVALSLAYGCALLGAMAVFASGASTLAEALALVGLIASGLWWGGNTIAHNFLHRPFFAVPRANRLFSLYLSVLLGFPQSAWRDLHLAHHAGKAPRVQVRAALLVEALAVIAVWAAAAASVPQFFFAVLPGYALGLALCFLQGHFEHAPVTASYYGRFYNVCFFNDGFHVEHHAAPQAHWTELPRNGAVEHASRFPPVLRWLERCNLETLERWALRRPRLKTWLLHRHARAFAALAPRVGPVQRIAVVGGALFPRTAIVCRTLYPHAHIRVIDASASNIATAQALLDDVSIEFRHATFEPGSVDASADLYVVPLALHGDRAKVYSKPPARWCIVHDWIWNRRGVATAVVSLLLLKRVNLVEAR
jgi:hypothetical protein